MNELYRDYILDHYRHPRNFGHLDHPDIAHEEDNPLCGDRIHLDLALDDVVVTDVRFSGQGCAISQASASVLTEMIKGQPLEALREISRDDILDGLGIENISPARLKCALLSLRVLRAGAFGLHGWPDEEAENGSGVDSEGDEEQWPPR